MSRGREVGAFELCADNMVSRLQRNIEPSLREQKLIKTIGSGEYMLIVGVH